MHRRKFLTLAALGTPVAIAADEKTDVPWEKWWNSVESPDTFTAQAPEGDLTLKVTLFTPPDDKVEEVNNEDGTVSYRFEGKKLPDRFWKGQSLLRGFDLSWDGKRVPVDPRFWGDLAGLTVQDTKLEIGSVGEKNIPAFVEFLQSLKRPHISISADKGTALIEWERGEECDSRSMIRWMVSRSGTVLRHRTSGDGC